MFVYFFHKTPVTRQLWYCACQLSGLYVFTCVICLNCSSEPVCQSHCQTQTSITGHCVTGSWVTGCTATVRGNWLETRAVLHNLTEWYSFLFMHITQSWVTGDNPHSFIYSSRRETAISNLLTYRKPELWPKQIRTLYDITQWPNPCFQSL